MKYLTTLNHHPSLKTKISQRSCLLFITLLFLYLPSLYGAVPSLAIPQVPLITASPLHPQVLILIGNSQSMDGTLSGAIMTGSGSLASAMSSLNSSSSPVSYSVPANYTPPLTAADASGNAPYTVLKSGVYYDNGPSRLNMAKAGVLAIIQEYMASTDFGLAVYNTSGTTAYTTWVYYMSPGASFTFTNTPVSTNRYVTNPCYNYTAATTTIKNNCTSIANLYGSTTLRQSQYMQISASSDDANINDILYASGLAGTFVTYSGPNPASPFPPSFSLANYNSGSVQLRYNTSQPNIGAFATGPTNAGYVPYSPQVFYAQRGFGYYGSQSANSGSVIVPMTSAGTAPTLSTISTAVNAFVPFLNPESSSASTKEIKAIATQSPIAGLLKQANTYLYPLGSTSGNGCPQKKYVILISDGLPTQDLSGRNWPPLGSASSAGYGVSATFNSDGSLKTTNNQAVIDTINSILALKANGILTYVVGMGAGVDPSLNPQAAKTLTAMAVAGGTTDYYPATSPAALVSDLNSILIAIQTGNFQASAAAVNSTNLNDNNVEYQASYTSNDAPYQDWTGDLNAIKLDENGIPTTTILWDAQTNIDNLASGTGWSTSRIISTWNPTSKTGVPFRWSNISTAQQALLQPSDSLGPNRLNYIRGNSAEERHNGGSFRNRSHLLGDNVNSQVLYVGPPNDMYPDSSYASFVKTNANRSALLYIGSNDGMMHAIDSSSGKEVFAFIPNAVFANLANLTYTIYNQSHLFYVDGSPQSKDVLFADNTWHTILVGGENAGGNSIYALDITTPSTITSETALASSILWEFTDADMGLSYSQPQIARIQPSLSLPGGFAVFFGNGYNSPTNQDILYAVDPKTGTIIRKLNLCSLVSGACDSTLPLGLSTVSVANKDGLLGQPITNVYAGDLQGNLWSINVSDSNPNNWSVRLLFKAKDANGNPQAITTPPVISLHPIYPRKQGLFVMFGTGRLLTASDLVSTQKQTIYGIWDYPSANSTYSRANLQAQTLSMVSTTTSTSYSAIVTATSNTIDWNNKFGWYADLPMAGQSVITAPTIINGALILTVNTPPLTTCGSAFTSILLELNFATGGAFSTAHIDLNGDGGFTTADKYNGEYAVGIGLSNSYATAPTILGPNKNNQMVILVTQSNHTQSTVYHPNNTRIRAGWWQIIQSGN